MHSALVLDASERAALAVIRSLGRAGIRVTAADSIDGATGFLSKYCSNKFVYPSPEKNVKEFLRVLTENIKENKYDVVFPVTDFTTIPLSSQKDKLEKFSKIAVTDEDKMMLTLDKTKTIEVAKRARIPIPVTFVPKNIEEVEKHAKDLKYPVVVKPRTKVIWNGEKAVLLKVTPQNYAETPERAIEIYKDLVESNPVLEEKNLLPMIQEKVYGNGYGVEALITKGRVKASFVHKRLHEYPITGGASTLRESIKNEKLRELGIKMLQELKWEGVAMVEFKVDNAGDAHLIEVNGRLWGSLQLAIDSGVDFPLLYFKALVNEPFETVSNYKTGVRCKWGIPGEFMWLAQSLRHGRLGSIGGFAMSTFTKDDVMRLDDIRPTIGAVRHAFGNLKSVAKKQKNVYGETK